MNNISEFLIALALILSVAALFSVGIFYVLRRDKLGELKYERTAGSKEIKIITTQISQIQHQLGELNSLVSGVEHLEKILSNVKRRGILGEVQLGNIIRDILSKAQYEENIATQPGSANRVEFAVKLPGKGEGIVYLPIDAKFPADVYGSYLAAGETGSREKIEEAGKIFSRRRGDLILPLHVFHLY